jgi:chemotaxis protein methyltransferase CheR
MRCAPDELVEVARLVEELCGIVLDETKGYLVESRLGDLLEPHGCGSYRDLVRLVRAGREPELKSLLVDAITTNETLFFRDGSPFEALRHKVLPELFDRKVGSPGEGRLRVWSAACSTGQEPYSLVMLLADLLEEEFASWQIEVLGTDICDAALRQAAAGVYRDVEIRRGLSDAELSRHFLREGEGWRIRPELRRRVRFERRNLLDPFGGVGTFDLILCRNVAIYFKPDARRDLYLRMIRQLAPGGYFFTSSSESLRELDPRFEPEFHCRAVFYRPNGH